MLPFDRRQSDPSCGQDAPELTVREERDVSVQRAKMCDDPISAVGNLCRHFTARTAVPEHNPVRSPFANVHGALSFVIAVVPFRQVRQGAQPDCSGLDDTGLPVPPKRGSPRLAKSPKPVAGWRGRMKTTTAKVVAT
jgi:hypothetical protein